MSQPIPSGSLTGRTALVTGSSRGIGADTVSYLAQAGANVVINYRNKAPRAEKLATQLLYRNRRPPDGVDTWSDDVADDEITTVRGMRVTTPERTALDLACRLPIDDAVAQIDALARATRLQPSKVERLLERHPGRRGIRRARTTLHLVDPGAESPQETRLRLVFLRAGFPRPETQIKLYDEYGRIVARLDMGWRDVKVGADYEGEHHRTSRSVFNYDIRRHDVVTELGWNDVRYTIEDTDAVVVDRARRAFAARGRILDVWPNRFSLTECARR